MVRVTPDRIYPASALFTILFRNMNFSRKNLENLKKFLDET
jgi:hypothetical protein